jgi:hypothetical protein
MFKKSNIKRFGEWGFDLEKIDSDKADEILELIEYTGDNYEDGDNLKILEDLIKEDELLNELL